MKQTAVEWLHNQWANEKEWSWEKIDLWFKQAKEMERNQIIEAHGKQLKNSSGVSNYKYWLSGEKYYTEKYGG